MSALLTGENDFSSLLTTPRATRGGSSTGRNQRNDDSCLPGAVALLPTPTANLYECDQEVWEARREREKAKHQNGNGFGLTLAMAAQTLLPTPTVGDSKSARNSTANRSKEPPTGVHAGDTLTDAVTLLPTPRTSDSNGTGEHGTGGPDLRTVIGDHMQQPSTDGRGCSDDEHPTLWTSEDD